MRQFLTISVWVFGTMLSVATQNTWNTVEAPDKSFTIQGPGKPTFEKQPFKVGGTVITLYSYLFVDVPYAFILGYGDYPQDYIAKRKPEELLSLDRDHFVKHTRTKLAKEKVITHQGNPALEFVAESEDKQSVFQVRIVLVGRRVYVLAVSYPAQADARPADKFLDSFHLLDQKK